MDGDVRFVFPTYEKVHSKGVEELEVLRLGLDRHTKIFQAAERICNGQLNLSKLARPDATYEKAKRALKACHGIGPKIADCIALFALNKMMAFPVDSRVRQTVENYFPSQKLSTNDQMVKWAHGLFGKYAGYANQFLYMG